MSLPAISRQIENKAIEYVPNRLNYKIETESSSFFTHTFKRVNKPSVLIPNCPQWVMFYVDGSA